MERDELVAVALGEKPAGLVIRGGRLVNVYSGEIYSADVAVLGDRIAAVGDVDRCVGEGTRVVEAGGRYLVPGFIEGHIHVGATSLAVTEMARLLVPYGTAAIVTDFNEATKVQGPQVARYYLDEAKRTPMTVYYSPFHTSLIPTDGREGVTLEQLDEMMSWPEAKELREWNVQQHRSPNEKVRRAGEMARAHGLRLAGHLRLFMDGLLHASVASGAVSDHETYTVEEAVERIRAGVALQMRFGSAHWHEIHDILRVVTERRLDSSLIMFSTDEQEIVDVRDHGFLDHRVRMAIEAGVAPMDAVRMASLNPARYLGVTGDLGGIAPGRKAFVNLVDDMRSFTVTEVVYGEEVVAKDQRYVAALERPEYPREFYGTVRLKRPLTAEDFAIAAPSAAAATAKVRVIGFHPEAMGTKEVHLDLPVVDGKVQVDLGRQVVKLASVERIGGIGKHGVGFVQGLPLRRGALGFTYHPGPSELALIGTNGEDMALVGNKIAELGGGLVVAVDGEVLAAVPMPLHGVVSDASAEEVEAGMRHAKRVIADVLGIDFISNYYRLTGFFIPGVSPELRMSVKGLLKVAYAGDQLKVEPIPVVIDGAGPSA
ncbi:MAG: adenine deaminase [Trueperaceae bacterium]|nr:adenine deaminase [Trueperaceae bacterium]MCC6309744.1 adenine deaminase [Trueperaceae bacterium]MCO5173906.1 amidohydrolase family protein [Trueperaceae bacterium]